MADITIIHPESGGEAVVSQEALDAHYRQSGWMTPDELAEHQARLAEREQAAAKADSKTAAKEK
jgi:hypothetical protein